MPWGDVSLPEYCLWPPLELGEPKGVVGGTGQEAMEEVAAQNLQGASLWCFVPSPPLHPNSPPGGSLGESHWDVVFPFLLLVP